MCKQTCCYIKHIETCPFVISKEQGKCSLAGCNTTYQLIGHLRQHNRITRDVLPACFKIEEDDNSSDNLWDRDSTISNDSDRSNSTDSETRSPLSSERDFPAPPAPPCLLCELAFSKSSDEERSILSKHYGGVNQGACRGWSAKKNNCSTKTQCTNVAKIIQHWKERVRDLSYINDITNNFPFRSFTVTFPDDSIYVQTRDIEMDEVKMMFGTPACVSSLSDSSYFHEDEDAIPVEVNRCGCGKKRSSSVSVDTGEMLKETDYRRSNVSRAVKMKHRTLGDQ